MPSWRKPIGMIGILVYVTAWVILVASGANWIATLAWPLQLAIYGISGIVWILPLRPVLQWMETGRFRA